MPGDTYNGSTGVQHGDHNVQHNHFHAVVRPEVAWPLQVGVIPPRAQAFQDRAEIARLRHALDGGGTAVVGQAGGPVGSGVLAGLGGVGKTQLAADYARTAWESGGLDLLVWITASTRSATVAGYAQAAGEVFGADVDDADQAAAQFLAWLEPKSGAAPCRWLVVLDDLTELADLDRLWPPASEHGRTLVTTRRQDAALGGPGRRRIQVGDFTAAEAVAYLTAVLAAADRTEPDGELADLAADLGHLPLALSQAAAYLVDAGLSCAAYRARLATRSRALADLTPDVLPDGQSHTMAAAWALSVDYADRLRPTGLARPMLHLASLLDPNGIPTSVLTSPPALTYLSEHRTEAHDGPPVDEDDAVGALRALHRLSLLHAPSSADAPGQMVTIHQIVQRATEDTLTPDQHTASAHAAAGALLAAWPDPERDTALAQALRANTAALAACTQSTGSLFRPDAHAVLFKAGTSLGNSGQVTQAIAHFRHLTDSTTTHLGPDHPSTLTARNNLARWRGEAGDAAGAAAAFAELLTDRLRVLGPDHPNTLTARNNLAFWRGEAGDAAGAAAAFAELLTDRLRVLGPDHSNTLTARNNLAFWRGQAGDAAGAAAASEELLTDQVRVLGPDHPHTLATRSNLASWRGEAGDAAGAASATAELLTDFLRVLGPDHPNTLTARSNLVGWRGQAGDAAGAASATAELLTDLLRVLGPDHPHTLATRSNLASWRGRAGDAVGAAAAFAELLTDQLRVLGPDHPNTLATRNNLASWRGEAGDAAGAASAAAELLADFLRVLGPDHPHTLAASTNLAYWQEQSGGGPVAPD
ncbi:tetratricopeptide repeat protein [Streptomyces sp. NPDC051976]|uniref:tetratricopeptide repeat protein n=1 Tax=Streptomyces sp. NPDC051976 TaxID=3154947 RepID=UPI0034400ACA